MPAGAAAGAGASAGPRRKPSRSSLVIRPFDSVRDRPEVDIEFRAIRRTLQPRMYARYVGHCRNRHCRRRRGSGGGGRGRGRRCSGQAWARARPRAAALAVPPSDGGSVSAPLPG